MDAYSVTMKQTALVAMTDTSQITGVVLFAKFPFQGVQPAILPELTARYV